MWSALLAVLATARLVALAHAEHAECEAEQSRVRFSVAVQVLEKGGGERQDFQLGSRRHVDGAGAGIVSCVPQRCVETNLHGRGCQEIVSEILKELQSKVPDFLDQDFLEPPWLAGDVTNLPMAGPTAADRRLYALLRAPPAQPVETPETGVARVTVVGTHGPLSSVIGIYLQQAAASLQLSLQLKFYGQCHLCDQFQLCRAHRVSSPSDGACRWRKSDLLEQILPAAEEILHDLHPFSAVLCIGFFLCHFIMDAMDDTIARLQVLQLNPLQDVPPEMALPLLRAMETRLTRGEAIFASEPVTAALAAYHLNLPETSAPRAVAFLNLQLHAAARQLPKGGIGRPLLFAAEPVMSSRSVALLEEFLGQLWTPGVERMPSRYDLENVAEVAWMLDHSAVVYLPEHPAKLVFQDFYAMALPIFLPSLSILSWLWPKLDGQTYDGWFDRYIVPARIARPERSHVDVPEPFNLDVDGERKVEHWLRLSDFYHFPGLQVFHGLASIVAKLTPENLDAARVEMQKHFKVQTSIALSIFRVLVSAGARASETSPETSPGGKQNRRRRSRGDQAVHQVPFVSCMAQSLSWSVPAVGQLAAWKLRFRQGLRPPLGSLRLQVWRPITVGWQKGSSYTFRLVGEHLTKPTKPRATRNRQNRRVWSLAVPEAQRFLLRPGDRLAFAFRPEQRWWRLAQSRSRFTPMLPRGVQVPPLCLGFGKPQGECVDWNERKICHFQEQDWLPSQVVSLEAETLPSELKQVASMSLAFELPASLPEATFAAWMLEFMRRTSSEELEEPMDPATVTFFLCPLPESPAEMVRGWKKVFEVFDASLAVSTRCAEAAGQRASEAIQAAERLLKALMPHGIWVILSSDSDESFQLARSLAEANPVGLGLALRSKPDWRTGMGPEGAAPCSMQLESQSPQVCCIFLQGSSSQAVGLDAHALRGLVDRTAGSWSLVVFKYPEKQLVEGEEPFNELEMHLAQLYEAAATGLKMRNLFEVLRLERLWSAVDLRESIDARTSYEEFMTLRRSLPSLQLSLFEDKIQLRRWLQSIGVKHTPSIYMSNEDPEILPHLEGHSSFVVKPSHMTESEHVVVVREGRYVFDVFSQGKLQGVKGQLVDKVHLQEMVWDAWNESAFSWECQAVLAARPGVIVEHLVTARLDSSSSKRRVEEARVHVVWGRAMALEWAVNRVGSILFFSHIDDVGRWSLTCDSIWATHLGEAVIDDPDLWVDMVKNVCMAKVLSLAEHVASAAHVDHLRVDIFVEDVCDSLYVSEVELFPAVPFTPKTMQHIERRWRRGYGL